MREEISCPLIAFQAWRLQLFCLISSITQATGLCPVISLTKTVLWATACFTKPGGQAASPAQPASLGAAPLLLASQPQGAGGMRVVFSFPGICSCLKPGVAAAAVTSKTVHHVGAWCQPKASYTTACDSANPNLQRIRWKLRSVRKKKSYIDYVLCFLDLVSAFCSILPYF